MLESALCRASAKRRSTWRRVAGCVTVMEEESISERGGDLAVAEHRDLEAPGIAHAAPHVGDRLQEDRLLALLRGGGEGGLPGQPIDLHLGQRGRVLGREPRAVIAVQ